ncbi:MAG TPA: PQQ-dependent sugar dehydrogenase [Gammaproteobacteria bacterium]
MLTVCADATAVGVAPLFPAINFQQPVAMVQLGSGEQPQWLVVEKRGRIELVEGVGAEARSSEFADLRDEVDSRPTEAGLLGIALHPQFASNRTLFLSYTRSGSPLISVIARYTATADGKRLDPGSAQRILEVAQPYRNHNGGGIGFGPDGLLYIGLGDGGAAGDPHGNGQNTQTLLGKMLRIDVDGALPYAIPPDNPFSSGGGRPEIFAWGLRNPWRWSFDRQTGELWAGDVGQNQWEEIDLLRKGGNYGWNVREGHHCFRRSRCKSEGLSEPVAEYNHDEGCSVTGGYVYRGSALATLQGRYLYADYCSGKVWSLDAAHPARGATLLLESGLNISSFAEGLDGELYLLDLTRGGVYRLVQ